MCVRPLHFNNFFDDELPRNACANCFPAGCSGLIASFCHKERTFCKSRAYDGYHGQVLNLGCKLHVTLDHIIIGGSDFKSRRRTRDNYVNRRTPGVCVCTGSF